MGYTFNTNSPGQFIPVKFWFCDSNYSNRNYSNRNYSDIINSDKLILKYASLQLRNNFDIVLTAVKKME